MAATLKAAPTTSESEEDDLETKAFLEHAESRRPTLDLWQRVFNTGKSNSTSLAEEMEATLKEFDLFMKNFETEYNLHSSMKEPTPVVENSSAQEKEDKFRARIELGNSIMERLCEIMELDKKRENQVEDTDSTAEAENFDTAEKRIRDTSRKLLSLMSRFVRILEAEGIQHNLPVTSAMTELPEGVNNKKPNEKRLNADLKRLGKSKMLTKKTASQRGVFPSKQTQSSNKKFPMTSFRFNQLDSSIHRNMSTTSISSESNSSWKFLEEYADRYNLDLEYKEAAVNKSQLTIEYVYSCQLHTLSGEGRGKRRFTAKNNAACQVIKLIMKKQKTNTLPIKIIPLSKEEINQATTVICESEDYESALRDFCSNFNARPPVYMQVASSDMYTVRCKALGMNAIGHGKTKEIARRVAAKYVLDLINEKKKEERLARAF